MTEWQGEKGPPLEKISKRGKIQKNSKIPFKKLKILMIESLVETDFGDLIMSGSVAQGNLVTHVLFRG
ncbi:MAG: hypothetical protein CM15mP45_04570 [Deltaproteobacteria bacterium]|nr:MAG: hypothetical protein CM15mP45_04570 [Deltaproteobacteria bacterium]